MEEEAIMMHHRPLRCESLLLAVTTTEEGDVSGEPQIWISLLLAPEGDISDDRGLGGARSAREGVRRRRGGGGMSLHRRLR
jgi:hypothetical protein